jgi:hypothetical protein
VGFTDIYLNNSNFIFTRMSANFAQVSSSNIAFVDVENDGDLDVILNGFTSEYIYQTFYYQNINNTFTLVPNIFDDVANPIIGVQDLYNDGFDDVVISGASTGHLFQ